jgi:hypothetical protein
MNPVFRGLIVLCLALSGEAEAAAPSGTVELQLQITGAVTASMTTQREADETHFCALVGPAGKEQRFVLAFNKRQDDTLIAPADFGFALSASGVVGRPWDETRPSSILQVTIGNQRFIGLRGLAPDFRLRLSIDPEHGTGTFSADHMLALSGQAVIGVQGSWRCAPGGAQVAAASPQPAPQGGGRHFRLLYRECGRPGCASWSATDLDTGHESEALVKFEQHRLAPRLASAAREGLIALLVTGEAKTDGDHLLITMQRLDGVEPKHFGEEPGKRRVRR